MSTVNGVLFKGPDEKFFEEQAARLAREEREKAEKEYWARKTASAIAREDHDITYSIEGNKCVCRQK